MIEQLMNLLNRLIWSMIDSLKNGILYNEIRDGWFAELLILKLERKERERKKVMIYRPLTTDCL